MNKIEIIKSRVGMADVLDLYWSAPNWNGRYKCVFHNGVDYNMGVRNGKCRCFVCGATGDVLDVTQTIFNLSLDRAISKLDSDFRLGLNAPLTAKERRELAKKERAVKLERQRKKNMAKFEKKCLDEIAEKLKETDALILDKAFKGVAGSDEMFAYADSPDFALYKKAVQRKRWLEWLWNIITEDSQYLREQDFCTIYTTNKLYIMRRIYKGTIAI